MREREWKPEDFDDIVSAAAEAFTGAIAARDVVVSRPTPLTLIVNAVSRWELVIRGNRRAQVVAVVNPATPVFSEDDVAALRRMLDRCRLGDALRASGRPGEARLVRMLASGALV